MPPAAWIPLTGVVACVGVHAEQQALRVSVRRCVGTAYLGDSRIQQIAGSGTSIVLVPLACLGMDVVSKCLHCRGGQRQVQKHVVNQASSASHMLAGLLLCILCLPSFHLGTYPADTGNTSHVS
jgi:hypothetical protein